MYYHTQLNGLQHVPQRVNHYYGMIITMYIHVRVTGVEPLTNVMGLLAHTFGSVDF